MDKYTIIFGDLNASSTVTNIPTKQRSSKGMDDLSSSINQVDLTDSYRLFHPTTAHFSQNYKECLPVGYFMC